MNTRGSRAVQRMAAQRFPTDDQVDFGVPPDRPVLDLGAVAPTVSQLGGQVPQLSPVRRRVLLAAGIAAVVGAGSLVLPPLLGDGRAYAQTPPMLTYAPLDGGRGVAAVLMDLAAVSQAQPAPRGSGPFHYVHTRGWYLHADADIRTNRVLRSGIATVDRQQWMSTDGAGRLVVSDGSSMAPNGTYPAGTFTGTFVADDSLEALRAQVQGAPTSGGWVGVIADLWRHQVVPPAMQANLLTALAGQPGLALLGRTTDRAGRAGVAVSLDYRQGVNTRAILVFDQTTAALLDAEEIVLQASELPVHPPATIAYTVWLDCGYTTTTDQRP